MKLGCGEILLLPRTYCNETEEAEILDVRGDKACEEFLAAVRSLT